MAFRPLHDRVLVRRIEADQKTAGGIIIPDSAQEKPSEGEVIAVGPGARNEQGQVTPCDVKAGDRASVDFGAQAKTVTLQDDPAATEGGGTRSSALGIFGLILLLGGLGLGYFAYRANQPQSKLKNSPLSKR